MKKLFFTFLSLSVLFVSCGKDDECNTDVNSVAGTYRVTAVTYKSSSTAPEQDYYNLFYTQPCERDDAIKLNTDGTYDYDDAGTLCNPPNDYSGTWSLTSTTKFNLDGDDYDIASFDCKKLVLKIDNTLATGDEIRLTFTKL